MRRSQVTRVRCSWVSHQGSATGADRGCRAVRVSRGKAPYIRSPTRCILLAHIAGAFRLVLGWQRDLKIRINDAFVVLAVYLIAHRPFLDETHPCSLIGP